MTQPSSEVLNQLGFAFVGTVGQKDVYTVTNEGDLLVTDELGLTWMIQERELKDDQKCDLCGRRRYVSHLFAPQKLH